MDSISRVYRNFLRCILFICAPRCEQLGICDCIWLLYAGIPSHRLRRLCDAPGFRLQRMPALQTAFSPAAIQDVHYQCGLFPARPIAFM